MTTIMPYLCLTITHTFFDLYAFPIFRCMLLNMPAFQYRLFHRLPVFLRSSDPLSKYIKNHLFRIFHNFTLSFLKCFELDIFNFTFSEFLLYITSNFNDIYNLFSKIFTKFNFGPRRCFVGKK
jgi:hypothetical protein